MKRDGDKEKVTERERERRREIVIERIVSELVCMRHREIELTTEIAAE